MNIEKLFDLSGKVAVVTGGGDGIGAECCKILATAGASVMVSDISPEKAKSVAHDIVASGGKAAYVVCDVLQEEDLTNLIESTVKTFGTVNILVTSVS